MYIILVNYFFELVFPFQTTCIPIGVSQFRRHLPKRIHFFNLVMSNPSCPPSSDEILKSLRTQFKKLNELYEESLKVNNDLKNKLKCESKNRDLIKSLKRQRTYLGMFMINSLSQAKKCRFLFYKLYFSPADGTYC